MMSSTQFVRNLILISLCFPLWCSPANAQTGSSPQPAAPKRTLKDRVAEFQRNLSTRFSGQRATHSPNDRSTQNQMDGNRRPTNQQYPPPFRDLRTGRNRASTGQVRQADWNQSQHQMSERNMIRQARLQEPHVEQLPLPETARTRSDHQVQDMTTQPMRQVEGPPPTNYPASGNTEMNQQNMRDDGSFSIPPFDNSTFSNNPQDSVVSNEQFASPEARMNRDSGYSVYDRDRVPPELNQPANVQSTPSSFNSQQTTQQRPAQRSTAQYQQQTPSQRSRSMAEPMTAPQASTVRTAEQAGTPPVYQGQAVQDVSSSAPPIRSPSQYQQMRSNGERPFGRHDWNSRQLTATERALKLQEDNDQLQYKLQAMTKLNEQLREQIQIKLKADQKMREAIESANGLLDEAMLENQQLKAKIITLENAAKQKAFETERILQTLQNDLDQLLMNQMLKEKK